MFQSAVWTKSAQPSRRAGKRQAASALDPNTEARMVAVARMPGALVATHNHNARPCQQRPE